MHSWWIVHDLKTGRKKPKYKKQSRVFTTGGEKKTNRPLLDCANNNKGFREKWGESWRENGSGQQDKHDAQLSNCGQQLHLCIVCMARAVLCTEGFEKEQRIGFGLMMDRSYAAGSQR